MSLRVVGYHPDNKCYTQITTQQDRSEKRTKEEEEESFPVPHYPFVFEVAKPGQLPIPNCVPIIFFFDPEMWKERKALGEKASVCLLTPEVCENTSLYKKIVSNNLLILVKRYNDFCENRIKRAFVSSTILSLTDRLLLGETRVTWMGIPKEGFDELVDRCSEIAAVVFELLNGKKPLYEPNNKGEKPVDLAKKKRWKKISTHLALCERNNRDAKSVNGKSSAEEGDDCCAIM